MDIDKDKEYEPVNKDLQDKCLSIMTSSIKSAEIKKPTDGSARRSIEDIHDLRELKRLEDDWLDA